MILDMFQQHGLTPSCCCSFQAYFLKPFDFGKPTLFSPPPLELMSEQARGSVSKVKIADFVVIGPVFGNFVNCVMSASCSGNRLCKQWVLGSSVNEQPSFSLTDFTTAVLQISACLFHSFLQGSKNTRPVRFLL